MEDDSFAGLVIAVSSICGITDTDPEEVIDILVSTAWDQELAGDLKRYFNVER